MPIAASVGGVRNTQTALSTFATISIIINQLLRAPHRVAAVKALIARPVSHRNRPAVVARRGVGLVFGEQFATSRRAVVELQLLTFLLGDTADHAA